MADKRIRIELNVDEELGGLARAQSALDQFSRSGTAAFGKLESRAVSLERATAGLASQFGRHLPNALSKLLTQLLPLERSLGGLGRTLSQILGSLSRGGRFATPPFNPNAFFSLAVPPARDFSAAALGAAGIPTGGGLLDLLGRTRLRGLGPLSGNQLLQLGLAIGQSGLGRAGTFARTAMGALGGALSGLALGGRAGASAGPLAAGVGALVGGLLGFLGIGRGKLKRQASGIADRGFREIRRIFEDYKNFRRDFGPAQASMHVVWEQMVEAWQRIGGGIGERSTRDQRRYFEQILEEMRRVENERGIRGNVIRSLPAPSFQHGGFSHGGGLASLHPGEFVLSTRAVERLGAVLLQGVNSGASFQPVRGGTTLTIEPASAQHLADMFQRDPRAADRGLMVVVRAGGRFSRALRG